MLSLKVIADSFLDSCKVVTQKKKYNNNNNNCAWLNRSLLRNINWNGCGKRGRLQLLVLLHFETLRREGKGVAKMSMESMENYGDNAPLPVAAYSD